MNQESDDQKEMRPEYDIRGGVRGKYFERYRKGTVTGIAFQATAFIAQNTASALSVGAITRRASYPPPYPSPKIQIGSSAAKTHAG